MNCTPTLEWGARRAPLCDLADGDTPAEPSGNRRAAVLKLLAAAQAEDASERNRLRRQAAELIYPARRGNSVHDRAR